MNNTQMVKTGLSFLIAGVLLGVIVIAAKDRIVSNEPAEPLPVEQPSAPTQRPAFVLPDLEGNKRHISEWDGKVILLNFWATWCPPCRKEMPAFVEFREELTGKSFEIIGVAIDEAGPVQDFADGLGAEYPILLGELEGIEIMKNYGNHLSVLPFTVVIDQQGKIVETFRREIFRKDLVETIYPLLGLNLPTAPIKDTH